MLAPHQPRRATERRQVHQFHQRPFLDPSHPPTPPTRRAAQPALDMDPDRLITATVDHAQHVDLGQSHEQLTDADRVRLHRGPPI
jgi:hypothetical protein